MSKLRRLAVSRYWTPKTVPTTLYLTGHNHPSATPLFRSAHISALSVASNRPPCGPIPTLHANRPFRSSPNPIPPPPTLPTPQVPNTKDGLNQAELSRQAARLIRQAVQEREFSDAYKIHRQFLSACTVNGQRSGIQTGRLVTTALVHSLLRVGRRFKAAQVAESAWLGSPACLPTAHNPFQAGTFEPMKLSYKTSESIILALCPLLPQVDPPWKIFATTEEIGQHATVGMDRRRKITNAELAAEAEVERVGWAEAAEIPSLAAHQANVLQSLTQDRSASSNPKDPTHITPKDPLVDPPPTLDKATQRALLFLRVAQHARQRRTSLMFQSLIDACLLQGEIIVGTLLFVLLVRQWQARNILAEVQEERDGATKEATRRNLSQRDQMLVGFGELALSKRRRTDNGVEDAPAPRTLTLSPATSQDSVSQTTILWENAPGPPLSSFPNTTSPPRSEEIQNLFSTLLSVLSYPDDKPETPLDYRPTYPHQPTLVNPRYPRPLLSHSIVALTELMHLLTENSAVRVSSDALRSMMSSVENLSSLGSTPGFIPEAQYMRRDADSTSGMAAELPQLAQACVESLLSRYRLHPESFTADEFHALLWGVFDVLKSDVQVNHLLELGASNSVPLDDEATLAVTLEGWLHLGRYDAVERILDDVLARAETDTASFDCRLLLLVYASKMARCPDSAISARFNKLRTMLLKREEIPDHLPMGKPLLLNAVLRYLIAIGQEWIIVDNSHFLFASTSYKHPFQNPKALALAASFGAEFYNLVLRAHAKATGLYALGIAELVWYIARQAELHSWRLHLRDLHTTYLGVPPPYTKGATERVKILPWLLGEAHTTMMEIYSRSRRYISDDTPRPYTWWANRPLDSLKIGPGLPRDMTIWQTAKERVMELHELFVSSPVVTEALLAKLWDRLERRDGEVDVDPVHEHASSAPLETQLKPLIRAPDATYWSWALFMCDPSATLVPLRDPGGLEVWPMLKQNGGYVMKALPHVVPDDANPALRTLAEDMEGLGWYLGEQVVATEDEMRIWEDLVDAGSEFGDEESSDSGEEFSDWESDSDEIRNSWRREE